MEFISIDELQNRDANKAFFKLLSENNTHEEFVTAWNSYVTDTKLKRGLDFSQFRFDLNDENRDCFKFLLIEESHIAQWQFNGLLFPIATDFSQAQFEGVASFSHTQFAGEADFSHTQFEGVASFSQAKFAGDAYFIEAQFEGVAYFSEAEFAGDAYFSQAKFTGEAYFSNTRFKGVEGVADFSHAQFAGEANFNHAEFAGVADFSHTQFEGVASFSQAKFKRATDFREAQFAGHAVFSHAQFAGEAYFSNTQFKGVAYFSEAEFAGNANFSHVQFAGEANFIRAQFVGANFSQAQFEGRTFITDITMSHQIGLEHAISKSDFYLSFKEECKHKINLNYAIFDKYTSFDISNVNIIPEFDLAHFTNIALLKINDDFKKRKNTEQKFSLNTARFLKRYYANSLCYEEKHMYFAKELKGNRPWLFWVYDRASKCGVSFLRPFSTWIGVCFILVLFSCILGSYLTAYPIYNYYPLEPSKGCFEFSNILIRTLYPIHFKCMLPIVAWWESLILVGQSIINLGCIFLMGLALKNQLKIK